MFLTFLNEFEEDLDKDAVFCCFQRVVVPICRRPAGGGKTNKQTKKTIKIPTAFKSTITNPTHTEVLTSVFFPDSFTDPN